VDTDTKISFMQQDNRDLSVCWNFWKPWYATGGCAWIYYTSLGIRIMGVAIYYIPSVSTTGGGKRGCTPLYKSGNIYIYFFLYRWL
jgi:hypothetical protein